MALTLTATLGVPTTLDQAIRLTVTGTVPDAIEAGYQFRLEDEVLELKYFGKTQEDILGGAATQTVDDRNVWYAQRGLNGTTIASHAATTALLGVADPALVAGDDEDVPAPFAGGGGATSTLAAVLAAGNDTGGLGIISIPDVDVDANVGGVAQTSGTGIANASNSAESENGAANANATASSFGSGDANAKRSADTSGVGTADASTTVTAVDGAAIASTSVSSTAGSASADVNVSGPLGANADLVVIVPSGDGNASAKTDVTASGDGNVDAETHATAVGSGDIDAGIFATGGSGGIDLKLLATTATGVADIHLTATYTGSAPDKVAGIRAIADVTSGRLEITGQLITITLPTVDPEVAGALYTNAGVVMVSAG